MQNNKQTPAETRPLFIMWNGSPMKVELSFLKAWLVARAIQHYHNEDPNGPLERPIPKPSAELSEVDWLKSDVALFTESGQGVLAIFGFFVNDSNELEFTAPSFALQAGE